MEGRRDERRLAAILAADVVGYSRLMGVDEAGTLARLKAHRSDLIEPAIAEYRGRLVKLMGDGILAEFTSVVDAVSCAVEIQQGVAARNADAPEEQRITFRVGVNLGDIIIEDDDIYGDGVNVAARLEALAEPGGICISRAARDQVRDKLPVTLEDLGEVEVKNIARPVRVFRVAMEGAGAAAQASAQESTPTLPDKPSIAVLPFTNMSGDAEQEFFADGIAEDVITELSRFQNLFVIARNSTFTYKGQAAKVQDVGRDLGVRYVVEGSVRKAGNRVRVTVQLVDAPTGNHLWAERYDRELTDIFELQDEVTRAIVAVLPGRVESADVERVKRKPPSDMAAYDCVLRGKIHHHRGTKEDNAEALRLLGRAIELDPEFAPAYAWKACTLGQGGMRGYLDEGRDWFTEAVASVRSAISLDGNDLECHRILCEVNMAQRQWEDAEQHHERAFSLNPNDPRIVAQRGELFTWLGRAEEGAEWVETAMRLDPFDAQGRAHLLGQALFTARRYEDAAKAFKRIPVPRHGHLAFLAACYALQGRDEEAEAAAAELRQAQPDFTVTSYVDTVPYKDQADRDHLREGLRKAGLPD